MEAIFKDFGNSQTLKDKVYMNLRELIITGKITPGSRLLEEELSKQMNISRAPIREALNMLEREGFATIIPRKGTIVSEVTPQLVRDIWEMRCILEPYAAKASVGLIPHEEIARIDQMVHQVMESPENLELYVKCDLELHKMLYQYKENVYLSDYISSIVSHSMRVRYVVEYNTNTEHSIEAVREVCNEHVTIIEALKKGDADELYQRVLHHATNSRRRCEDALGVTEKQ